ncbi:hypothetical protein SprV_0200621000 [Sparganum proliferum]
MIGDYCEPAKQQQQQQQLLQNSLTSIRADNNGSCSSASSGGHSSSIVVSRTSCGAISQHHATPAATVTANSYGYPDAITAAPLSPSPAATYPHPPPPPVSALDYAQLMGYDVQHQHQPQQHQQPHNQHRAVFSPSEDAKYTPTQSALRDVSPLHTMPLQTLVSQLVAKGGDFGSANTDAAGGDQLFYPPPTYSSFYELTSQRPSSEFSPGGGVPQHTFPSEGFYQQQHHQHHQNATQCAVPATTYSHMTSSLTEHLTSSPSEFSGFHLGAANAYPSVYGGMAAEDRTLRSAAGADWGRGKAGSRHGFGLPEPPISPSVYAGEFAPSFFRDYHAEAMGYQPAPHHHHHQNANLNGQAEAKTMSSFGRCRTSSVVSTSSPPSSSSTAAAGTVAEIAGHRGTSGLESGNDASGRNYSSTVLTDQGVCVAPERKGGSYLSTYNKTTLAAGTDEEKKAISERAEGGKVKFGGACSGGASEKPRKRSASSAEHRKAQQPEAAAATPCADLKNGEAAAAAAASVGGSAKKRGRATPQRQGPPTTDESTAYEEALSTSLEAQSPLSAYDESQDDCSSAGDEHTFDGSKTCQSKSAVVETPERQGEPTPTMHFDFQQNAELSGSPRFSEALTEDSPTSTEAPGDEWSAPHEKKALSNGESCSPPAVQLAAHSPSSPAVPSPTPVGEGSSDRQQPKKQKSLLKKMAAVFKPSSEGTD